MKRTITALALMTCSTILILGQSTNAQSQTDDQDSKIAWTDDVALLQEGDLAPDTEQAAFLSSNNAFGNKVAGTYVDNGVVGGGAFTGLQTLGPRGTQSSTNQNSSGWAGSLQSNGFGAWKKTGPNQITVNSIIQIFGLDGVPSLTARVQVVADFLDNSFSTASTSLTTELFFWPPNTQCTDDTDCEVGESCIAGYCDGLQSPDVLNDVPNLVVCGTSTWTKLQVTGDAGDDCTEDNGCTDLRFLFDCD